MRDSKINGKIVFLVILLSFLLFTKYSYGATEQDIKDLMTPTMTVDEFEQVLRDNGYVYLTKTNGDSNYIGIFDNFTMEQETGIRLTKSGLGDDATGWYMQDIYGDGNHSDYDEGNLYLLNNKDMLERSPIIVSGSDTYVEDMFVQDKADGSIQKVTWSLYDSVDTTYGFVYDLGILNQSVYWETNNIDIENMLQESFLVYNDNINYTGIIPTKIEKPSQTKIDRMYTLWTEQGKDMYEVISHRPADETGHDYIRYEYFAMAKDKIPYADESIYSNNNQYAGYGLINYLDHTGYVGIDYDGLRYWHIGADELVSLNLYNGTMLEDTRPRETAVITNTDDIEVDLVADDDSIYRVKFTSIMHDVQEYYDVTMTSTFDYTEVTDLAVNYTDSGSYPYVKVERVYDIDLSTSNTGWFHIQHGTGLNTHERHVQVTDAGQMDYWLEQGLYDVTDVDGDLPEMTNAPDTILGWLSYYGNLIQETFNMLQEGIIGISAYIKKMTTVIGLLFSDMPPYISTLIMVSLIVSMIKIFRG